MANKISIKAEKRVDFGKKTKGLRSKGLVPAEIYGHGFENIHISVKEKDLIHAHKEAGGNTVVSIFVDKENFPSLIYNVQIDPISQRPFSVDFYRVREGEKLQAEVPLRFIGEAPIEKEGFVVVKVLEEVEVESTPANLPSEIEVDLSKIKKAEDLILIKDLKVPAGVEILASADTAVVTVSAQREEVEEVPEEEVSIPEELEITTDKDSSEEEDEEKEEENK